MNAQISGHYASIFAEGQRSTFSENWWQWYGNKRRVVEANREKKLLVSTAASQDVSIFDIERAFGALTKLKEVV